MESKAKYMIQSDIEGNQVVKEIATGRVINTYDSSFTTDEVIAYTNELLDKEKGFDVVKKPEHYNSGKYEVIDIIDSVLTSLYATPFQAYCLGNSLKYICRAGLKGDFTEDIKKAIMYLSWAIGDDPRL